MHTFDIDDPLTVILSANFIKLFCIFNQAFSAIYQINNKVVHNFIIYDSPFVITFLCLFQAFTDIY